MPFPFSPVEEQRCLLCRAASPVGFESGGKGYVLCCFFSCDFRGYFLLFYRGGFCFSRRFQRTWMGVSMDGALSVVQGMFQPWDKASVRMISFQRVRKSGLLRDNHFQVLITYEFRILLWFLLWLFQNFGCMETILIFLNFPAILDVEESRSFSISFLACSNGNT